MDRHNESGHVSSWGLQRPNETGFVVPAPDRAGRPDRRASGGSLSASRWRPQVANRSPRGGPQVGPGALRPVLTTMGICWVRSVSLSSKESLLQIEEGRCLRGTCLLSIEKCMCMLQNV